ncbi:MAG: D-tyrosyl-tRNA(Tyr) deacylase [Thermotoga sp.]|nr:D-tyrosyl-tRNA(Tyr) deacylase [Thermotogota bacterium]RKX52438.1 MAG: D-tyrosyl-tRNA(Tyr) deacylase [Thermotoga sp.]
MRAVVQRVSKAKVTVNDEIIGKIEKGLLILLGVGKEDDGKDVKYMCEKIVNLRIFEDEKGKMNLSLLDTRGEILIVSQFTLYGDCKRGRRPSFDKAADVHAGEVLYEEFVKMIKSCYPMLNVQTGKYRAYMQVISVNDGPVTILIDSKKQF